MKKVPVKKSYLKGYAPSTKIVGGVLIGTTVIVGGYFGYNALKSKPAPATPVTSVSQKTTPTTTVKKTNYNGRYIGNTSVANGISAVDVTVNGSNLNGRAVYSGDYVDKMDLDVTGTVDKDGKISGRLNGSKNIMGQTITVTGTFAGHIINTTMNISYSAVTPVGTFPGSITLSKQ